jgi:hypothetical protein
MATNFVDAFAANAFWAHVFVGYILQLIASAFDRFNARGSTLVTIALNEVDGLTGFFWASADNHIDFF